MYASTFEVTVEALLSPAEVTVEVLSSPLMLSKDTHAEEIISIDKNFFALKTQGIILSGSGHMLRGSTSVKSKCRSMKDIANHILILKFNKK